MITIKKADGTFAKVPLSDIKKAQAAKKAAPIVAPAPARASTPNAPAAGNSPARNIVSKTTIEIKEKKEPAKPAVMTRDDARSLLEEKKPAPAASGLTSQKREKQVEEVIRMLGFSVDSQLQGRLKSLVLARLKDIKTDADMQDVLCKPVKNGGFGLADSQAQKMLEVCRRVASSVVSDKNIEVPVLKGSSSQMLPMVEPPELPMALPVSGDVRIKNSTPVRSPVNEKEKIVSKIINESLANEPVFKISAQPPVRPIMQDITVSDVEMGPIEEIRSMTIEDFRRLSSKPEEAAKRVLQKILNLKDESYVWYMDGVAAFHSCPLYVAYMNAVAASLAGRKTVANVLAAQNSIKLSEVMAIIEIESAL